MKNQNYSNHSRYVLAYHVITLLGVFVLFVGTVYNLMHATPENKYDASLLLFAAILLGFTAVFARTFALRAQDRAICAEEKFRYYLLTKKAMPKEITVRQLVGLRFASDEEFPDLVTKAAQDNMPEKAIKKAIKNWKGDYYRV